MSETQTWTTTGPTITTTTTRGSDPHTIVTHSDPRQPTTTTTTTTTSHTRGGQTNTRTTASSATGNGTTTRSNERARQPAHARGVPADPPIHEHNAHHGLGEDAAQHAEHSKVQPVKHWGLPSRSERLLFYSFAFPAWALEITAAVLGSLYSSHNHAFIATFTVYQVLHWSAWAQTVVQMMQRSSWVRDEGNLADRRCFLYLAVRLNRLMLPTAVIALPTFIVAYVQRGSTHDVAYWLLFLLFFIFDTVFSVMNAYNNITWESDRLEYEEGSSPYGNVLLAALGFPSKPSSEFRQRLE